MQLSYETADDMICDKSLKKDYRALNKLTSGNTVYRLYDHISQRFPLPFGGNLPNLCHQSMMSQLKWIQKTSDKCPQLSKPPLELECKAVIVELKGPFVHYQNGSEIPFRVILGFSICLFNAISQHNKTCWFRCMKIPKLKFLCPSESCVTAS